MTSAAVVLVNGLPASGKMTLGRALARHLSLPLFSKDVIKEVHADMLGTELTGWPQRRWNAAIGAAASETMWALLARRHHQAGRRASHHHLDPSSNSRRASSATVVT